MPVRPFYPPWPHRGLELGPSFRAWTPRNMCLPLSALWWFPGASADPRGEGGCYETAFSNWGPQGNHSKRLGAQPAGWTLGKEAAWGSGFCSDSGDPVMRGDWSPSALGQSLEWGPGCPWVKRKHRLGTLGPQGRCSGLPLHSMVTPGGLGGLQWDARP